jgi:enterochelin esterase family protein
VERFVAGGRRQVHLYQPPVQGPVPLLVVWDGLEYARLAKLTTIVDNMIAQGRIRPLALALVQHGGAARLIEYACNDATLGFLQAHVLPLAAQHLGLVDLAAEPGAYGIMGASMGGLMALYSALRLPQVFGAALSQSGAFDLSTGDTVIYTLARLLEPSGLKVWMDVGQYDIPRLVPANERMARLLSERGYALTFRKYPAGHNFTAWRDELWRGLEALFGRSPGQAPG